MVGQWTMTKPSRSDEVLDANQQLQITNQIRAQFDSMVPKRPSKPSRSESDTTTTPTSSLSEIEQDNIPELDKLRSLQSQSPNMFCPAQVLFSAEGANMVQDEFVETQYYTELDSIDKQHHTTGSGFINVVRGEEHEKNGYGIQLSSAAAGGKLVSCFRSNPATNDWTPSPEDDQVFVSSKPNRSESC
ncbi:hypothetical protein POPTR_007G049800v4 [Populus trichocarpa]|uniref:Uncharacterized protein n=2 Tax=Populus TaxID=3689 RepID=A0A3N7F6I5_POPTR|nr:uncharacterized protein LOC18101167 isoform X1 [Populus trichocarpa]KAH8503302.1 hypothetical protein H0E87_014545 [Populus deltoides]RQO92527.1 hypothetical protein POPTR_007G049800v4 [Populus trichocarpa]|eukprot:XP_024460911.1 uncharacterized protein LOC18101167 isoform X1 [Populus trichocarpa]